MWITSIADRKLFTEVCWYAPPLSESYSFWFRVAVPFRNQLCLISGPGPKLGTILDCYNHSDTRPMDVIYIGPDEYSVRHGHYLIKMARITSFASPDESAYWSRIKANTTSALKCQALIIIKCKPPFPLHPRYKKYNNRALLDSHDLHSTKKTRHKNILVRQLFGTFGK